jgi:hypothetical protein
MQAGATPWPASLALLAGLAESHHGRWWARIRLPPPTPRAPHDVVLVTLDTLRRDRLPIYGHPLDTAPT